MCVESYTRGLIWGVLFACLVYSPLFYLFWKQFLRSKARREIRIGTTVDFETYQMVQQIKKIITSCKTHDQLNTAREWLRNLGRRGCCKWVDGESLAYLESVILENEQGFVQKNTAHGLC